ncbi:hypothetical protein [Thiomicrorhabdus aquaedulcis]|uniref:hypothetical protein n=1 Tax=Thiomicrorhabdus aquaedulcis TaxID=2211106 RepID=UPI000FD762A3|nr:hypothetical protein [Thiomicrorhabdus aquaedulcis]
MQWNFDDLQGLTERAAHPNQYSEHEKAQNCALILQELNRELHRFEQVLVQDLSHISTAAIYAGNLRLEAVVHLKDNLYRCDYGYDWQIGWTCSGLQENGRVYEKMRFNLANNGEIIFKPLQLD